MADVRAGALAPSDFGEYFAQIHGSTPFPWQDRLLEQVAAEGRWPTLLDLPTGAGKTAAIDVALFHLALDNDPARPPAERTAPRRIVMVVDRRTVVDQAFERAKAVARALAGARSGVLKVVADRLRSLSDAGSPLALAHLRGGMPRDDAWARWPDQALVAVSTVDQVGSRLLFRGYGVSHGMRPVHAGLLGNDALLLLDEVHLSEPFRSTLEAIARYRRWARAGLPDRWQFVEMSATPGRRDAPAKGEPFRLDERDRADERLARRLRASKPVELAEVKVSGGPAAKAATFADECAKRAAALATPGQVVGIVVNRVATARAAAAAVKKLTAERGARVFLVTGRMRPLDRDDLDAELAPLVRSGRERDENAAPVVVVATQCIEAGADFDFDALVTECAALDALRQRFGRLNRLGDAREARGVVLARSDALGKDDDDPVYGRALARTWQWLQAEPRDLGIEAMKAALEELAARPEPGDEAGRDALTVRLSPRAQAPVMLPAHLDAWAQTAPPPVPDPEPALWLHGIGQAQAPEVQIVWRADLTEPLLARASEHEATAEALRRRIEACPPVGLEAVAVPIGAARAWLLGDDAPDVADVEGRAVEKEEEERRDREARPALLWLGDESAVIRTGKALRPGCTIIVPSEYGGIAGGNWDPSSEEPVRDLGDRARWQQTRRPVLRLHPGVLASLEVQSEQGATGPARAPDTTDKPGTTSEPGEAAGVRGATRWAVAPSPDDADDPEEEDRKAVREVLAAMAAAGAGAPGAWWARAAAALTKGKRAAEIVRLAPIPGPDAETPMGPGYLAVVGRARVGGERAWEPAGGDVTTEGESGSHIGVEITLREHLDGVARWARRFADRCGLPTRVAESVALAAAWHDAGKVDARFQKLLRGGSDARVALGEPLAKSRIGMANRAARERAQKRSGYPRGARHELSSVALLAKAPEVLGEEVDADLVLHLIASHHGWCRPFAPVADRDSEPVEMEFEAGGVTVRASSAHGLERLDSGIADRFWTLVERYGWHGLAWLEAIVRLADHRRSEEEQRGEPDTEESEKVEEGA